MYRRIGTKFEGAFLYQFRLEGRISTHLVASRHFWEGIERLEVVCPSPNYQPEISILIQIAIDHLRPRRTNHGHDDADKDCDDDDDDDDDNIIISTTTTNYWHLVTRRRASIDDDDDDEAAVFAIATRRGLFCPPIHRRPSAAAAAVIDLVNQLASLPNKNTVWEGK